MSHSEDTSMRELLDSAGTLEGGIVFGKEQAWEKLQARLDKKPARKITLWHIAAVAALLLITVLVAGRYTLPIPPRYNATTIAHTSEVPPQPPVTTIRQETTATYTTAPLNLPHSAIPTAPRRARTQAVAATPVLTPQITVIQQPASTITVNVPAIHAQTVVDGVVHINDLDNNTPASKPVNYEDDRYAPSLVNNIRVIHINDLGRPGGNMLKPKKVNTICMGNSVAFLKPANNCIATPYKDKFPAHTLIRINVNNQN